MSFSWLAIAGGMLSAADKCGKQSQHQNISRGSRQGTNRQQSNTRASSSGCVQDIKRCAGSSSRHSTLQRAPANRLPQVPREIIQEDPSSGSSSHGDTPAARRRTSSSHGVPQPLAAIIMIYLLVFFSGIVSGVLHYVGTYAVKNKLIKHVHGGTFQLQFWAHCIVLLRFMIYPLLGLLADIYYGRYWIITFSMSLLTACALVGSVFAPFYLATKDSMTHSILVIRPIIFFVSYLMGIVGIAGFEANVVQFGLDQLMDSSSRHLSLYLHGLVLIKELGVAIGVSPLTFIDCRTKITKSENTFGASLQFAPLFLFLIMVITLIVIFIKRHTFYREFGSINPYKMVFKVICYALKHRHPTRRRSAFYYHSGIQPTRLDFAKEPFGGPFTTEHVENVKTFLQILSILLSLGPLFILKVSASYFMYQHFVHHFVKGSFIKDNCIVFWPLLGSGNQISIFALILFPLYTFAIFKLYREIPKMLSRLLIGLVLFILCFISILAIEVIGHSHLGGSTHNGTHCALTDHPGKKALGTHWALLLVPNILLGLANPIIYATIFEFMSAQCPKFMTGFLIGMFYFIQGIFQIIGIIIVIPFTLRKYWHHEGRGKDIPVNVTSDYDLDFYSYWEDYSAVNNDDEKMRHFREPVFSLSSVCELWYLVVIITLGCIGILLYCVAAWRYKYRRREENPIPQTDIEDIIIREIDQDLMDVTSVEVNPERRLL